MAGWTRHRQGEAATVGAAGAVTMHELQVQTVRPVHQEGMPDGLLRLDYTSRVDGASDWALVWPPEGVKPTWVVNLHGHGSQGDQLYTRPDIQASWLPEFRRSGVGILTPNLRDNAWMSPAAAADLRSLLRWMRTEWGAARFVVVGGSMGGAGTLIYAALHPEDVAAAVALCPATDLISYYAWCRKADAGVQREIADAIRDAYGGEPHTQAKAYTTHSALRHARQLSMPLFVAHGARDQVIPVAQARRLVGTLATARNLVYMEVPDGDHDAPLSLLPTAFGWALKALGSLSPS